MYYYLSCPSFHVSLLHVSVNTLEKLIWAPYYFKNLGWIRFIYGLLLGRGLKFPSPTLGLKAKITDLEFSCCKFTTLFPIPLMDLVHIWQDDKYWSKHFLGNITTRSCANRWDVHGMATCEWGGHDVVWTGCGHVNETVMCERGMCERGGSHVKRTITSEPGCRCVNWLFMFELGHMWAGCGHANEVVTCERFRSNSGSHVWTGWSRMNGMWSCERGRYVWTVSGVIHFISIFWLDILKEQ